MKGPWVAIFAATVLVGCRSSQPATNPFLRTTVPPPGTGQAVVVAPGEPYSPVVPGQAPVVGAPIVTPVTPVGPPVAAPMPVAPPPRDHKYVPPGGTFLYNQSSNDRPQSIGPDSDDMPREESQLASGEGLGTRESNSAELANDPPQRIVLSR